MSWDSVLEILQCEYVWGLDPFSFTNYVAGQGTLHMASLVFLGQGKL